ncbi:unnamed protein product [Closterium sp. NIES-64]|nr:unnamed protein product [Closterium sp. NIES-64]
MEQDARIARERVQQPAPSPHVRDDNPAHADNVTDLHAAEGGDDGWLRCGQAGEDPSNPDADEEVWVRSAAEMTPQDAPARMRQSLQSLRPANRRHRPLKAPMQRSTAMRVALWQ